jgi:hypothetical protein
MRLTGDQRIPWNGRFSTSLNCSKYSLISYGCCGSSRTRLILTPKNGLFRRIKSRIKVSSRGQTPRAILRDGLDEAAAWYVEKLG